jgi:hypothetical protein
MTEQTMARYKNHTGRSNITSYNVGKDFIQVSFMGSDKVYKYSHASAGKDHIDEMKKLAESGTGLSSYIAKNVKDKYVKH